MRWEKLASAIFEINPKQHFRLAIISPHTFLINSFLRKLEAAEKREGLFTCWISKELILIRTPQHAPIIDVLLPLRRITNSTVFIGLCGGLRSTLEIGEIVMITSASLYGRKAIARAAKIMYPEGKEVTSLCVHSMLLEYKFFAKASIENFDVVDMESYFVLKYGKEPTVLSIVSDLPLKKPFYQVTMKEKGKIIRSGEKLVEFILNGKWKG